MESLISMGRQQFNGKEVQKQTFKDKKKTKDTAKSIFNERKRKEPENSRQSTKRLLIEN